MKLKFIDPDDAPEDEETEYLCLVIEDGERFFLVGRNNLFGWLALGGVPFRPHRVARLDPDSVGAAKQ